MAGIEVLAPLRIETRFTAPDLAAGRTNWRLRLRVLPDEFSMRRSPPPPASDELERVNEALAAPFLDPPIDEEAAFCALADAVGAARAVWLLRTVPRIVVNGVPRTDLSAGPRDVKKWPAPHRLDGLPPELGVWLVTQTGTATLAETLRPDRVAIGKELDLFALSDEPTLRAGKVPRVWWNSFERATAVGLATTIELGPAAPDLEAIVVVGSGDTDPAQLVADHAATGRLAVIAQGTPTNTVDGEATTELGRDPRAWFPLVAADPVQQPATSVIIGALTGTGPATIPLQGGGIEQEFSQLALVSALWDVLWGRAIRDVTGSGSSERLVFEWARENLAPQGPYPAIRVGEQPYGVLPATALSRWVADANDPPGESEIRSWSIAWREAAAKAAETAGNVVGATTERFVALLGETAPSRRWAVRPVASLAMARTLRAMAGMPTVDTSNWDDSTAIALASQPRPLRPLAPLGPSFPLPDDPLDRHEKRDILVELLIRSPGDLLERQEPLGLLGHLLREAILLARARVGLAFLQQDAGNPVDRDAALPIFPSGTELVDLIAQGDDVNVEKLRNSGDPAAIEVADRFERMRKAARSVIDRWDESPDLVFSTLLAVLDTASHRVDPWITGLANRRLRTLSTARVPFRLGAYGWVDRPRPASLASGALPPGPTSAGLLHAPSYGQALTAALLRDAAIRHPGDDRWKLTIDSEKVRAALRLAERVRLGVHPYEALGLEVERLVGDWNAVRALRTAFPQRAGHEGKRGCDGVRVLNAVLRGAEPLPAGLPADLGASLAPLAHVLDTYADLLVADGVHALVSGRADLANAAMEAAAGLGAPPDLRAMKTPRRAGTVRVSAWALLKPGSATPVASPALIADPPFAQLLDDELGPPGDWTWNVHSTSGRVSVSLANRGLHGAMLVDLPSEAVDRLIRGSLPAVAVVESTGGLERLRAAAGLAELLGGGDDNPPVPDPSDGRDDAKAALTALRAAMLASLQNRLVALRTLAVAAVAAIDATDPNDPTARASTLGALRPWRLDDEDTLVAARATLNARIDASASVPAELNALRRALRALANAPRLPILPVVARTTLPSMQAVPAAADGRPSLDRLWLEIVAAVRPRLALLEARQLDPARTPWPAVIHATGASIDPWTGTGPIVVGYGPAVSPGFSQVAVAALDAWVESIPSPHHGTSAAFGFNGPKSRPPQAILLAVPPDASHRLTARELVDVVLETRQLARARSVRPDGAATPRIATPSALASLSPRMSFLDAWWTST